MCVIIYKKSENKLDKNILKRYWKINNQGGGIAYRNNSEIIIEKGFFDYNLFIEKIDSLMDKELVIHMRLATHGMVNEANCQPFPVSKKLIDLRKVNIKTNCVFTHNGIFDFIDYDMTNSDSLLFVKNYLAVMDIDYLFNGNLLDKIANYTYSRLLLWHIDYGVKLFGNWIIQNDIAYSNGLCLEQISYNTVNDEIVYKKCYFCSEIAKVKVGDVDLCENCYKLYTE